MEVLCTKFRVFAEVLDRLLGFHAVVVALAGVVEEIFVRHKMTSYFFIFIYYGDNSCISAT